MGTYEFECYPRRHKARDAAAANLYVCAANLGNVHRGADKSLAFPISPTFILIIILSRQRLLFCMSDLNLKIVA
jgi:hypothetical protein